MDWNGIIHIKDKVEWLFNDAIKGIVKGKPISIGVLTPDGRHYLEGLSSLKFKERVDFVLNPSDLVHIHKEHFGEMKKIAGITYHCLSTIYEIWLMSYYHLIMFCI